MAFVQYGSAPAMVTDRRLKLSTAATADSTMTGRAERRKLGTNFAIPRDSLIADSSRAHLFGPTERDTSKPTTRSNPRSSTARNRSPTTSFHRGPTDDERVRISFEDVS